MLYKFRVYLFWVAQIFNKWALRRNFTPTLGAENSYRLIFWIFKHGIETKVTDFPRQKVLTSKFKSHKIPARRGGQHERRRTKWVPHGQCRLYSDTYTTKSCSCVHDRAKTAICNAFIFLRHHCSKTPLARVKKTWTTEPLFFLHAPLLSYLHVDDDGDLKKKIFFQTYE